VPCPLFEPLAKVVPARDPEPRLPLIHEYDGICHAGEERIDPEHRFHCCNRGNAKGTCASFPANLALTAIRFSVTARTASALTVLMVEEHNHWPGAWKTIDFMISEKRVTPEVSDVCRRAQILRFCDSYLEIQNGQ
jgi:hypothetical protein